MKTVSTTLTSAILENTSASMLVKATIDPSRTFFSSLAENHPYDAGNYMTPTDTPVGQCIYYSTYKEKVYTFIVNNSTGGVSVMESGSSTVHSLGITANKDTKPSVEFKESNLVYLYYWNNSPSELKRSVINLTTFAVSATETIPVNSMPASWTIVAGSPTVIGPNQLALFYKTSKGGIGVAVKLDNYNWSHWNQRFLSPKTLTATAWTIYTSAVVFGESIYLYSTDIDAGNVRGVQFNPYRGSWSDMFIALPADFSRFDISNAVVANGYIHLAGKFHRTGEYVDAQVYSLVLRSSNGINFSWDRFTLLSAGYYAYQFHIALDTTNSRVYASDRNSVGVANMSYYFTPIPTNRVSLNPPNTLVNFGSDMQTGTLVVADANEVNINNATVVKGSRVTVHVGYKTTIGTEYVKFGTYIIDSKKVSYKDGKRQLVLSLINEGMWKTSQIAFPFYSEILSKSSIYDNCDEQDKMYVTPCYSGDNIEYMTIDLWNSREWDGDGVITNGINYSWSSPPQSAYKTSNNVNGLAGQLRGKTIQLNAHPHMTSYPSIIGSFTANLFGWEHTDEGSRPNNTYTLYAVTAPEDDLDTKTVTTGTLTSTNGKFPQYYADTEAGDYPITFSFTGITIGHKLLYLGITAYNYSAGTSHMFLERIEVTGVQFAYSQLTSSTTWSLGKPDGETREYLISPDSSLQNLMFTTKPYTAFNYSISAEFGYSEGADSLSAGTTAWGVVGMAKDGFDYIVARYNKQRTKIELCLVRNGLTTILSSVSCSIVYQLLMEHRNGQILVWHKTAGTDIWVGPVINYAYDEITYGAISTSDTGIMHTGIYSAILPPSFIAVAFAQPYSDGICLTTDQHKSVLDGFPSVGRVIINGVQYNYTGKTTNSNFSDLHFGPHELRQVTDIGTWQEGGTTFSGVGIETTLYKPEFAGNSSAVAGLLLGQSNYHNWIITQSDWTIEHSTGGVIDYLRNRSKHYSASAVNESYYSPSTSDKCYINHGLTGISTVEEQSYMHPNGSLVALYSTDKIWAKKVVASALNNDATVKDMITLLCHAASIEPEFPGDWTQSSLTVTSSHQELAEGETIFPGGCDIRFTIPNLPNNEDYIAISPTNLYAVGTTNPWEFGYKNSNGKLMPYIKSVNGNLPPEYFTTTLIANTRHDIRILIHGDFVSMYVDNISVATFALGVESLEWHEDALTTTIYSNTTRTIENIVITELFDWREAIYIESEMSASSAIGSVIQERPIEIYPTSDGHIVFSYNFEKDLVEYSVGESHIIVRSHDLNESNSDNAGSDALVYYSDITFVNHVDYALTDGFNTRVFKLSTLASGAKLAAKLVLDKAYEKQKMHSFTMRPDIRLEIGDKINVEYALSGTGTVINTTSIIESMSISIAEGTNTMSITARDKSS